MTVRVFINSDCANGSHLTSLVPHCVFIQSPSFQS